MKCCVLSCKNYSDRRSDAMDGITFHVFPSDDNLKQQWMTKINRRDWTPTKYTKICSCHFNEEDFVMTKKGLRKLKKGTLPSLKLDISVNRRLLEPTIPSLEPTTSDLNEFLILHDTPKKKKLKQEIEQLRWKAKKDGLKIRRLQMKLKRLKKKVPTHSSSIQFICAQVQVSGKVQSSSLFISPHSSAVECSP
ncbi:unnamed protein product [Diatraea saccharalis]|uniref:THAP-type domain-containing protein n=1 Tax=Diatraea saccharalis TaxID=40085 RepID=A0A9N9R6R4_9NEOP|nr:unnamed protein product [Diatraea saccharalis]